MIQTGDDRPALCAAADRAGWAPCVYEFHHDNMPQKITDDLCVLLPGYPTTSTISSQPLLLWFLYSRSNLLISVSWFSLPFRDTTKSHYVCHGLCVQAIHLLEEERRKKKRSKMFLQSPLSGYRRWKCFHACACCSPRVLWGMQIVDRKALHFADYIHQFSSFILDFEEY